MGLATKFKLGDTFRCYLHSVILQFTLQPTNTLPYLYHSRLHRCPPILWKKESISVFYVVFENRCFEMVKSSMFWDIWLFWKLNGFFLYSWPFSLCHKVIFLSYVLQKIMESLNLSYEIIEKLWLKNYQCNILRSQNMDDLSI